MNAMSQERLEYFREYRKKNIKRIPLDIPIEEYNDIKTAADAAGEPVNTYIKTAIKRRIESGE